MLALRWESLWFRCTPNATIRGYAGRRVAKMLTCTRHSPNTTVHEGFAHRGTHWLLHLTCTHSHAGVETNGMRHNRQSSPQFFACRFPAMPTGPRPGALPMRPTVEVQTS